MPRHRGEPGGSHRSGDPEQRGADRHAAGDLTQLAHLPTACVLPDLPEPYAPHHRRPATDTPCPATARRDGAPLVQALPLRDDDAPGGAPLTGYLLLVPPDARPDDPTALAARAVAVQPQSIRPVAPGGGTAAGAASAPSATGRASEVSAAHTSPPVPATVGPDAQPGLVLDADRRVAELNGQQLDLTYLEFELLHHLAAHPYRVHSRSQLVTAVWGYGHVGDGRTVDVHIARLRRKLGPRHRRNIVTVRRVGYKYLPIDAH